MTEFSRELIFGKRPIRRTERKPGESEWYYLDPRGASTFSDMKKIDVPTENTPNPYANEIQNYLYKNDEYNYRELYGDTPPPVPQPSTQPATQPTAQPVTLENKDTLNQIGKNLNNILKSKNLGNNANTLYNWSIDGVERLISPQTNKQNYQNLSSLGQAEAEAQRLKPIPISDVDKHQYVSCVGAFDGSLSADATMTAGILKEIHDLYIKLYKESEKYKNYTKSEIIQDSFKDLRNDAIGITKGLSANNIEECNYILPLQARRK